MLEVETIELLWRLLPAALLIPFITFFLGRISANRERKLEYRTFFTAIEMKANYKLTNLPNVKSRTKHLIPPQFKSAKEMLDMVIKNPSLGPLPQVYYLRLNTFGKSIITGCHISVTVSHSEGKEDHFNVALPVLEKEEEIFIPVETLEMEGGIIFVKEINIKYTTQAGEKLVFKSLRERKEDGDIVFKDNHSTRLLWFFPYPISSTHGMDTPMILLKGNGKNDN